MRFQRLFQSEEGDEHQGSLGTAQRMLRMFGDQFLRKSARNRPKDEAVDGANYRPEWHDGVGAALQHYWGYGCGYHGVYSDWAHWDAFAIAVVLSSSADPQDATGREEIGYDAMQVATAALGETIRIVSVHFGLAPVDFSTFPPLWPVPAGETEAER